MPRSSLRMCEYSARAEASTARVPRSGPVELACRPLRVPAALDGPRPPPAERRLRARREPHLELRPLAARDPAVPAPLAALHGEVRALLVAAPLRARRCRRVSRGPRRRRRGGDRDRGRTRPRWRGRGHVPRRDEADEGAAEEVGGPAAHRRGADRARRRRSARSGGDQGHRPACSARSAPGRLRRAGRGVGGQPRDDRAPDGRDPQVVRDAVTGERPLLAVDGDSFAHRAYHALPKSIRRAEGRPAGAIVGFANMLVRLWEAEQPRTVLVAWDTLSVPTYRHEAFDGYQSGREFDAELLEQLELLPQLVSALGFAVAKGAGYEADDFLAAAAAHADGPVLVATSDRDAFQLASDHVTILQPTRGVSQIARIGPAEVRERYGVEPAQVPDFIALRGDPSDRLPGARGVGEKGAAEILRRYGSLEAALADGRFSSQAEELRLYRRIATLDASAPLPALENRSPTWAEASALTRDWGLGQLAGRLQERA